eukprot:m.163754 g.163754  ORF g.163754 m.163754 type:complete len:470 (+) comp38858_c0_seq14:1713-3122(+)
MEDEEIYQSGFGNECQPSIDMYTSLPSEKTLREPKRERPTPKPRPRPRAVRSQLSEETSKTKTDLKTAEEKIFMPPPLSSDFISPDTSPIYRPPSLASFHESHVEVDMYSSLPVRKLNHQTRNEMIQKGDFSSPSPEMYQAPGGIPFTEEDTKVLKAENSHLKQKLDGMSRDKANCEKELEKKNEELASLNEYLRKLLKEKETWETDKVMDLKKKEHELWIKEQDIVSRERLVRQKEQELSRREKDVGRTKEMANLDQKRVESVRKDLMERENDLVARERRLGDREKAVDHRLDEVSERERRVRRQESDIERRCADISGSRSVRGDDAMQYQSPDAFEFDERLRQDFGVGRRPEDDETLARKLQEEYDRAAQVRSPPRSQRADDLLAAQIQQEENERAEKSRRILEEQTKRDAEIAKRMAEEEEDRLACATPGSVPIEIEIERSATTPRQSIDQIQSVISSQRPSTGPH